MQLLPISVPVLCVRAGGCITAKQGQGLGVCNNSVGTPRGDSVTLARQGPPGPAGQGPAARGAGTEVFLSPPGDPGFPRTGRRGGSEGGDDRENQKPILLLTIFLTIDRH